MFMSRLRQIPTHHLQSTINRSNCGRRYHFAGFATVAVGKRALNIPVVDFSGYRHSGSTSEKRQIADQIVSAFKDSGFLYLAGHGIPTYTVQNVFQKSADFFKLPMAKKAQLAWEDPRSNRGYVQVGRERVTQSADADEIAALRASAPDFKESMEIGRDWDKTWRNMWPLEADVPGFKQTMLQFFQTCHELHTYIMRAIAVGLDMEEMYFEDRINEQYHNLRLLSYPPIKTSLLTKDGQARAGAHSDYGTLTLLFQDNVGGLQVRNPHTGEYQAATPIPDTIVINCGDLLSRWSNDVLRSTLHRVVAPSIQPISGTEGVTPQRQSIAFFCNPNAGAEISCLPTCYSPSREKKYQPVTTEEYIVGRLKATYM
ncbi:Clavaminate synthase-like protein [Vararia minispora EC-137]|uniref:Clavaminate synthase-like protein n=1 Tax=Vararia minispora EC-137 TaxID=1314806 RepID=A0ACB8QY51_9AGAM|nr:Clavaminate synthase-like protein [Vararia minispora EC-137]